MMMSGKREVGYVFADYAGETTHVASRGSCPAVNEPSENRTAPGHEVRR